MFETIRLTMRVMGMATVKASKYSKTIWPSVRPISSRYTA